jgi:nucleoside-diphosphate-sugar epimerase
MKILVTGCSGYIGSVLIETLLADPQYQVVGVDRVKPARLQRSISAFFASMWKSPPLVADTQTERLSLATLPR